MRSRRLGWADALILAIALLAGGSARPGEDGGGAKPPDPVPPAPVPNLVDPSGPRLPEPVAPESPPAQAATTEQPADTAADVVDLMDVSPLPFVGTPRSGPAPREAAARSPAATPQPGDPEFVRAFPDDDAPPVKEARRPAVTPAASTLRPPGPRAPEPGDPEFGRAWPADTEEPFAGPESTALAAARPAAAEAPRFVIGEGLDDDGEPAVVAPAAAEVPPPKAVAPKRPKPAPAAPSPSPAAGKAGPRSATQKADSNQRLQDDLELIKKAQAQLRAVAEAEAQRQTQGEQKPEADQEGEFVRTRDRRAAQALQALWDKPLGQLTGRIVDAETRQPIPARVRIVDASNVPAAATLPEAGFYCEGVFSVPVIAGNVKVEVSAGRFRSSFSQDVSVPAGVATALEAVLQQPAHLRFAEEGWYLADLDWSARARRSERPVWLGERPQVWDAVLAARAEGLDVVGVGVPEPAPGEAPAPPAQFLAELDRWTQQGLLVLATFPGPQHSFCGTALGVGVREWAGLPHYLGDPRKPLADYLDAFRQDGALAALSELQGRRTVNPRDALKAYFQHLVDQGFYLAQDQSARLYAPAEFPHATVAGPAYDVLAFDGSEMAEEIWFNLLNEGYPIPILGSLGGSLEAGRLPFGQTLAKLDGRPTREGVVAACRQGRSVVSFGPAVFAELVERARGVGDRVPADGRAQTLRLRVYASLLPGTLLDTVEILRNGEVIHTEKCALGLTELRDFRFPFTESRNSWYVVRVTERSTKKGGGVRRAWTNPIYFDTAGRHFPEPATTRFRGTLRRAGGTPLAGTVTVLEPEREDREIEIGRDGCFDVKLLSAGTLVFAAPGYEPAARKPFEDRRVQRALGAIHAERETTLRRQLTQRALFATWRLLLAELNSDVELQPLGKADLPPPKPEPGEQP